MTRFKAILAGLGLLAVIGLVGLLFWLPGQNDNDSEKLQGCWRLVAQAADGEPETTINLKDLRLVVEDDRASIIHDDETIETSYTLGMTKRPKTIDMMIADGPDEIRKAVSDQVPGPRAERKDASRAETDAQSPGTVR